MAVPLAAPRKDGSRHPTVHQSNEVMTSTPVSGGHGFGVRFQDEIEQTEKVSKEYPKLTETVGYVIYLSIILLPCNSVLNVLCAWCMCCMLSECVVC